MTTSVTKRCEHCKSPYFYHPSTYGFVAEYNDERYCPDCQGVIEEALKSIPVKFRKRFVDSSDYTREQLQDAQRKRMNETGPVARVLMTLNTNESICKMMPDLSNPIRNVYYSATWWTKKLDKVEVCKEVW